MDQLTQVVARVVAPDSLVVDREGLNDEEKSAIPRTHVLRPADIILVSTPGTFYSIARKATRHKYDHIVVVLNDGLVLHVGPSRIRLLPLPRIITPSRNPMVLRPNLTSNQIDAFLHLLHTYIGKHYDLPRVYEALFKISMERNLGWSTRLRKLKQKNMTLSKWICSDVLLLALMSVSDRFKDTVSSMGNRLDYHRLGVTSLEDFLTLANSDTNLLSPVKLPDIVISSVGTNSRKNKILSIFKQMGIRRFSWKDLWYWGMQLLWLYSFLNGFQLWNLQSTDSSIKKAVLDFVSSFVKLILAFRRHSGKRRNSKL